MKTEKTEHGNPDRVDRDAQAREEERVSREKEAIEEMSAPCCGETEE